MKTDRRERGLWWDQAWKLVEGCTKVSPGCDHCWSESETVMRAGQRNPKIGERAALVTQVGVNCKGFNGTITLRGDNLDLPLRTRKPTVFAIWNDLYHEDVPDDFRDRAYAVMALCPQHTFLVLTKRAGRIAEYWSKKPRPPFIDRSYMICAAAETYYGEDIDFVEELLYEHVWHGVTAENQETADERIPHLLRVPGKRFLSIEPMLEPVGMHWYGWQVSAHHRFGIETPLSEKIHAVILGGESGKDARPMHPQWARTVRDQCAEADVPFFFKQWGEWEPVGPLYSDDRTDAEEDRWANEIGRREAIDILGRFAEEGFQPPPKSYLVERVGKKRAGRTLDCRTHDYLPW